MTTVLRRLIPILFLGASINLLGALIVNTNVLRSAAILASTTLLCIAGFVVLYRAGPRPASYLILFAGWIVSTLICLTSGGLRAPGFFLFSVLSFLAGALLGKKALYQFAALTVVTMFALAMTDAYGWLPPSSLIIAPFSEFFHYIALLTVVWSLQQILTTSLTDALALARNRLTSRNSAEAALQKSEQRLKQSQRVAHIGHYEFDLVTGAWTCSEMLNEIYGIGPDYEKSFRSWGKLVHREDREMMLTHMKVHVLKKRKSLDKEYRIVRRNDGAVRWVRGLGELEFDKTGHPIRIFGVIQDITEHKRIEDTLAAERESLAVTLRSIGDGVITTDLQGRIVLMNRVAETMTGWTQQEAAAHPLTEIFPIIDEFTREVRPHPVDEVLRSGTIFELANHTVLVNRQGREFLISDSGAPIFDRHNRITGVVLVFRDSTEKQRMAEHMQRTDKLQSIGVLAGGLAHDFNNLLGGLFGYLELALHQLTPEVKAHRYISKAMVSFNRITAITRQLLTFSKGGAPNRKTGPIGDLLRQHTAFALSGSNILPQFLLPDDLWLCDFDEGQLGQVIDNIVINAKQAMPEGGMINIDAGNVTLGPENEFHLPAARYVRFSFKDTGSGIPAEILPRIFDPFFTTKQKGAGLGLTTVYSIVQKHGGTLTVDSKPEKGTMIAVYLPASECRIEDSKSSPDSMHHGTGWILVMDDEESVRETTTELLKSFGYNVECASEGKEALALFRHAQAEDRLFKAAIMDLTVPGGMGGLEAVTLLLREFPGTIVFVSSGYSNDPVLANPQQYGFTDMIQKPFRTADLSKLLERHLSSSVAG
ncbi:MAG TPA: ATP-binding protein [Bacteroidota bacterium]|nr:ATP-binding protein [Bacteroidota bacterium]